MNVIPLDLGVDKLARTERPKRRANQTALSRSNVQLRPLTRPRNPTSDRKHAFEARPSLRVMHRSLLALGAPTRAAWRAGIEVSDHWHRRLLRAHRERPYRRRARDKRDELAAGAHSITSSARASSVGGTSSPSAFAVLRLITSSNLVGAAREGRRAWHL
jgi:hypothetical protein